MLSQGMKGEQDNAGLTLELAGPQDEKARPLRRWGIPRLTFVVHSESNKYGELGKAEERESQAYSGIRGRIASKSHHTDGLAVKETYPN